jgi:hypothetical protein
MHHWPRYHTEFFVLFDVAKRRCFGPISWCARYRIWKVAAFREVLEDPRRHRLPALLFAKSCTNAFTSLHPCEASNLDGFLTAASMLCSYRMLAICEASLDSFIS